MCVLGIVIKVIGKVWTDGSYTSNKRAQNGFRAEAQRYSADKWKALTVEQKTQVKALHKMLKYNRQSLCSSVQSVVTMNEEGAIVPYVNNNIAHNGYRHCNRMNSMKTIPHANQGNYYNVHYSVGG